MGLDLCLYHIFLVLSGGVFNLLYGRLLLLLEMVPGAGALCRGLHSAELVLALGGNVPFLLSRPGQTLFSFAFVAGEELATIRRIVSLLNLLIHDDTYVKCKHLICDILRVAIQLKCSCTHPQHATNIRMTVSTASIPLDHQAPQISIPITRPPTPRTTHPVSFSPSPPPPPASAPPASPPPSPLATRETAAPAPLAP